MKKVFRMIGFAVVVYWSAALALCWILVHFFEVDIKYVATTSIQFFGGLATFSAVVVSLFGSAIRRRYDRPRLSINCAYDDAHCVLKRSNETSYLSSPDKRVEIYLSVMNSSEIEAQDAQLVCLKAFVSEDGEHFNLYQTFRAASFRWLYSSDDKRYLTTLRHSIEKYAKVIEVVEKKNINEPERKANEEGLIRDKLMNIPIEGMHFEICLALNIADKQVVQIETKYRAVMLSVCLAASNTSPEHRYLLIHNKAVNLESMPGKDRLDIRFLTKAQAQEAVSVNLD